MIGTAGGLVVYIQNVDDSAAEFFNSLKLARDLGSRQPAVETRVLLWGPVGPRRRLWGPFVSS
jgi:hypothetical protein